MQQTEEPFHIGQRIVVTGMAGAGKSTLSKMLAAKTGLPLIHLDLHSWLPDWVRVPEDDFVEKQRTLLASSRWIVDSNDVDTHLLLERADTLIILSTPWWICAYRAFLRGLHRPSGSILPEGCSESHSQRIHDEWGIVWRNWKNRHSVPASDLKLAKRCEPQMKVFVLGTKRETSDFVDLV